MSLKPTKVESGVFKGCLFTALIGLILGGIGGFCYIKFSNIEISGAQSLFTGMVVLISAITGAFVGGLIGAILNAVFSKKEKEDEEF